VRRPTSIGRRLPGVEVRLVDSDGNPVGDGEPGEIVVRGAQVVSGYVGQPEETRRAFRGGWFHTGDLGRTDADGYYYVVGRIKDVIIRGGENINAAEIESCLAGHPDVIEAAAFGVPHASLGEEVAAAVLLHPQSATTAADLRGYVAERLAHFKVPAYLYVSERPLPRTASGKIVKRDLASFVSTG
jgi:long-chain acyl-CoA synthetase